MNHCGSLYSSWQIGVNFFGPVTATPKSLYLICKTVGFVTTLSQKRLKWPMSSIRPCFIYHSTHFTFSDSSFILPSHFVSIFSKCEVRLNAVYATTAIPLWHGGYLGLYSIFHLFWKYSHMHISVTIVTTQTLNSHLRPWQTSLVIRLVRLAGRAIRSTDGSYLMIASCYCVLSMCIRWYTVLLALFDVDWVNFIILLVTLSYGNYFAIYSQIEINKK